MNGHPTVLGDVANALVSHPAVACDTTIADVSRTVTFPELADGVACTGTSPHAAARSPACTGPRPRSSPVDHAAGSLVTSRTRARLAFERARSFSVGAMTATSETKTWIITGASSGLGLALAETALAAGEHVVGTARRADRFDALEARYGERFLAIEHDVRDTAGAHAVVRQALEVFGRVDVLVNNAGAGQVGAAEEITDAALRDMLEQHLFGPAAYVRAVLPHLRQRRSGAIVQMSSQGGRMSFPAVGSYSAGKFALEGWSEALAGEIAPFGIRVLIVEPSRFRTAFNAADVLNTAQQSSVYEETIGAVRANMAEADGIQEGDPARAAQVIRDMLDTPDAPLRLPLGAEAVRNLTRVYRSSLEDVEKWASVSESADFPGMPPAVRAF
ncbi:SDR family NAD(P)-dependent oxidoreductase [Nocardia cyriacigeorgica]|nr:SDR family NAD(P)-dependent oxidoreductase [Nocardia cyriacigeorgica]